MQDSININHGSGGRQMHELITTKIIGKLKNGILERMDDSAILKNHPNSRLAMTTDSYVVNPLFFSGGDIGRLAVSGTINDLATSGAKPYALSLAFILEEGMPFKTIEKIVDSIVQAANEADVKIVTGDTKVVEKGKGDQIFINTCGIGFIENDIEISTYNAKVGDSVIISGPIGNHEVAMMKARNMIDFEIDVESDAAPLNKQVEEILAKTTKIHTIKDPTRGGLASALQEICDHSNCQIQINETEIPIDKQVQAVCDLIGFDPLYMANEGKFIIICPKESEKDVLSTFTQGKIIGEVKNNERPSLVLQTSAGGMRRLSMLETTQLPRIC